MTAAAGPLGPGLHVLVVDDEQPAREELAYLLGGDHRIERVDTADCGAEALRVLETTDVDAVFLDVAMPDLTGVDVARVLARFRSPPGIVFVTAHDGFAVDAFDLHAVDYLLKPVSTDRLTEAVRRLVTERAGPGFAVPSPTAADASDPASRDDEVIVVERAGVTRFVRRGDVVWVEAHGDYARLHTEAGSHLVRVPLSALEERWAAAGFVRIHRSLLVDAHRVLEVRTLAGRTSVLVPGPGGPVPLQVARRHARDLRALLLRRGRG